MYIDRKNNLRDKRFITAHRGGPLIKQHHQELMRWAVKCSEHVLPLIKGEIDSRITDGLQVAKEWAGEQVATGIAMKASVNAHAAAREASDGERKEL